MSEVERLYTCVICGRAWSSKQGLRGHMKAHKGEYVRTSIHVRRDLWKQFDKACKDHKTTTCALLDVLVKAALEGVEKGVIDLSKIGSPNPVIINVNEYFLGKPRSSWKADLARVQTPVPGCPSCGSRATSAFKSSLSGLVEGSCLACGAEWLVHKKG